jgi:hypothetical protein
MTSTILVDARVEEREALARLLHDKLPALNRSS